MSDPSRKSFPRPWRRAMRTPEVPAGVEDHDRTTVLLECAPENSPMLVAAILDRAEVDVIVCEGPKGSARCPVATGGDCSALDSADVVVHALGTTTPELAEVLPALLDAGVAPSSVITMGRKAEAPVPGVRQLGPHVGANELIGEIRAAAQPAGGSPQPPVAGDAR